MADPYFESFSAEYVLAHGVTIREWPEEEAHMDENLYARVATTFGEPVIGLIDGVHYTFKPSREVFSAEVAVPDGNSAPRDAPETLLVRK